MNKLETLNRMHEIGAMAILRPKTFERAVEVAEGCLNGGIPMLEISYTLNSAGDMIKKLKEKYGDQLVVGAGTVLDSETARHAILNDADFIISANYDEGVAFMCNKYQIPYAPGCTSLTEAIEGLTKGASFIKAFPISNFYGPELVNVFKTPIPKMPIMASGGITLDNLKDYLKHGTEICCFGGLLANGTTEEIQTNAQKVRDIIDEHRNQK